MKKKFAVTLFYFTYQKGLNNLKKFPGIYSDYIFETENLFVKKYALYAFTPDENIANYFWKTRDHKKFYKKVLIMDNDEYNDFCDEYIEALLEFHLFSTKNTIDDKSDSKMVHVLCTRHESDSILYHADTVVMRIIEEECSSLLGINDYTKLFKAEFLNQLDETLWFSDILYDVQHYVEYSDQQYMSDIFRNVDELAVFVHIFSNTLDIRKRVPIYEAL